MKVEKVVGQWYDVNCYVVTNDKKQCLIVEAGASLDKILPLVEGKKVVAILLTHGHFDHTLYLEEYMKYFKVPVYGSEYIEKTLKDHKLNQAEDWCIKEDLSLNLLSGDGEFQVGDFEVEYFAAAGHSPCCECYKIGDIVMAGDVLFNSGIGRLDLVGSDKQAMTESLDKLSKIKFDMLYSGHGQESDYARQKRNIAVFKRFLIR